MQCEAGARMGFNGKQVIHPGSIKINENLFLTWIICVRDWKGQVDVTQLAFTPSEERIKRASGLIEAFRHHQASGQVGSISLATNYIQLIVRFWFERAPSLIMVKWLTCPHCCRQKISLIVLTKLKNENILIIKRFISLTLFKIKRRQNFEWKKVFFRQLDAGKSIRLEDCDCFHSKTSILTDLFWII